MPQNISPQFAHLPEYESPGSLWLEIATEGEVLLDPTGQVRAALRKIRQSIAHGQFIRKVSHGHPYWVKVDNAK